MADTDNYINSIINAAPKKEAPTPSSVSSGSGPSHTRNFDRKSHYGTVKDREFELEEEKRVSCGAACGRLTLFVLNGLFFLCGAIVLGFTLYLLHQKSKSDLAQVFDSHTALVFVLIAVIGLILFAAFGFLVAKFPNRCLLFLYSGLLGVFTLVFVCTFLAMVIIVSNPKIFHSWAMKQWETSVKSNPNAICEIQTAFKCTGFDVNNACTSPPVPPPPPPPAVPTTAPAETPSTPAAVPSSGAPAGAPATPAATPPSAAPVTPAATPATPPAATPATIPAAGPPAGPGAALYREAAIAEVDVDAGPAAGPAASSPAPAAMPGSTPAPAPYAPPSYTPPPPPPPSWDPKTCVVCAKQPLYPTSCFDHIRDNLHKNFKWLSICSACILGLLIGGVVAAVFLYKKRGLGLRERALYDAIA